MAEEEHMDNEAKFVKRAPRILVGDASEARDSLWRRAAAAAAAREPRRSSALAAGDTGERLDPEDVALMATAPIDALLREELLMVSGGRQPCWTWVRGVRGVWVMGGTPRPEPPNLVRARPIDPDRRMAGLLEPSTEQDVCEVSESVSEVSSVVCEMASWTTSDLRLDGARLRCVAITPAPNKY